MAPHRPERALVLGSGALQIGQAGEFDYSGSQALKALREDGVYAAVVNPNIATVQTSETFAQAVYFLPVEPAFVEKVIAQERIDAVLLGFGGQTALNCGLALEERGALARHGVKVLGTPLESIRAAEDRQLFARKMAEIDVKVARSIAASTKEDAMRAAATIGYPVVLRAAFSLGGKGSAIVAREEDLAAAAVRALAGVPQVLIEECLYGWKELEYEIVRDATDNCIAVCNMENVDPTGIHTGESIVFAPSQTLNDEEYRSLRSLSIKIARHLGIVGECNVQFALEPKTSDYRVIEVNPRLSRSSALASKATGYPLAYVAAKIALGHTLPELKNAITKTTSAFFEPALDYVVCKAPRWDFEKFEGADTRIGTEMKSVGEVMAIGRTLGEALQKALRMLEIGVDGLDPAAFPFPDVRAELASPSPRRVFAIAKAFAEGMSLDEAYALTKIDRLFLSEIERLVRMRRGLRELRGAESLDRTRLREAKRAGFSDRAIASSVGASADEVRARRSALGVRPHAARIDTLAAEYPAQTNYMYFTYAAEEGETLPPSRPRRVLVLGSGCYRIGSSVEFDWCSVGAVQAARELGIETLILNCNPETVSTDYDICDRLYFDEVSLETVLELCEIERPDGVILSMGGQTPNNLALGLAAHGIRILGTSPESIDQAEDRQKFSALCDALGIAQPRWTQATNRSDLPRVVAALGGFPVVVRPSYVLSGAAMRVAHGLEELSLYLARAAEVSPEHPVVLSKFERHAREIELDAVAQDGTIVLSAISEHIECAGVHSGDATLVLPPQDLTVETVRRVRRIGERLAKALRVTGPFNVQLLARHNDVKVIECNLRASRSFPFVSKVLGTSFVREATRLVLGEKPSASTVTTEIDHVGVKAAQFSFRRLAGADPVLGIEMASTGEVACFGDDVDEALLKALLATGFRPPKVGVLLSLGPVGDKYRFTEEVKWLHRRGLRLFATSGTADVLAKEGIESIRVDKATGAVEHMRRGDVDLVINVPREYDARGHPDGFMIRRAAIDLEIPLLTDLWVARKAVHAMQRWSVEDLPTHPWHHYTRYSGAPR